MDVPAGANITVVAHLDEGGARAGDRHDVALPEDLHVPVLDDLATAAHLFDEDPCAPHGSLEVGDAATDEA